MKRYLTKDQVDGMNYDSIKERVYWALKRWREVEIYQANGCLSVAAGCYLPPDPPPPDFLSIGYVHWSTIYTASELAALRWNLG